MSWNAREDNAVTMARGFGIASTGRFYAHPSRVHERIEDAGLVAHDIISEGLAKQAEAGDEFAARALAEALRRRMMK